MVSALVHRRWLRDFPEPPSVARTRDFLVGLVHAMILQTAKEQLKSLTQNIPGFSIRLRRELSRGLALDYLGAGDGR